MTEAYKRRGDGMNREDRASRGISVRNVNFLMALVMMVISILLLIATYNAKSGYSRLRVNTEHYIQWQHDAYDLQTASDYLTEQVRCFAETGKRTYLDNYFEEAEVTRRRDRALKRIYDYLGDTRAYEALDAAMSESVELMNREYYSMRLTVEAYGGDLSEYPEAVRQVALTPEAAALSPQQKEALARSVVFDDAYHEKKQAISRDMQECLDALVDEIGGQQEDTANQLDGMLFNQRLLIIATICITVLMMLMTLLLVIGPLLKAVMYIRSDEPIPIRGSNEFQFLART